MRIFSNWTKWDIWQYINPVQIKVMPLLFLKLRPTLDRDGLILMVDDDRSQLKAAKKSVMRTIRYRTLRCYFLLGAVLSKESTLIDIINDTLLCPTSKR